MAETISFAIKLTEDQLTEALANIRKETDETNKKLGGLAKVFKDAGAELSAIKASFIGNLGADVVQAAFRGLTKAISGGIDEAKDFSRAIAEVNSTLTNGAKVTEAQARELKRLGIEFGTTATKQAQGFREIVSAGIEDVTTAFDILKNANNAALAGFVDTNEAAKLITSTLGAYASQGVTVAEVTDTLSAVTQVSAVKFEELSQSMGRILGVSAQSGISLGELGGSIAALRNLGSTSEQAITGLGSVINSVIKPSVEAAKYAKDLGIEFNSTALKSKGLAGFIEEVTNKTGNNSDAIAKLFGDQKAINTVLTLGTSNFDKYRETIEKTTNSLGSAATAANVVKNSLAFKIDQRDAALKALSQTVGEALAPSMTVAATATVELTKALFGLNQAQSGSIERYNQDLERQNKIIKALEEGNFAYVSTVVKGFDRSTLTADGFNKVLEKQLSIRDELQKKLETASKPVVPEALSSQSGGDVAAPVAALSQEAINERKAAYDSLLSAQTSYYAQVIQLEADQALLEIDFENANKEAELARLYEFNQLKIDEQFRAEEEKNRIITDGLAKKTAIEATEYKKSQALLTTNIETKKKLSAAATSAEIAGLQRINEAQQAAANLGAAIAKDGSKAQFLIQKASAIASSIIQTRIAVAGALASGPPFPNVALGSFAQNVGNVNTAAIVATAIKGFAGGGIIGATSGPDNRLATVRDGEMVLNANQQKSLFDAINGGGLGGGQTINLVVDGRTLATVIRDQIKGGFQLV